MPNAPDRQTAMLLPLLVDAREAARLCGVSRSTWLSLRAQGRTPRPVHLGRRVLWRREETEEWVREGCPSREAWTKRNNP